MSTLQIESAPPEASDEPYGLWGRAFRPFFLAAGAYGALAVPWWSLAWLGFVPAPVWAGPAAWHGHEMVFGFAAAAIAGFLLTASPVWTGGPVFQGRLLALLLGVWLAGRLAMAAASALPAALVALVDLAFLAGVLLALLRTLYGSGQVRNYALAGVVAALLAANAAMHAEAIGLAHGVAAPALRFSVDLVVVLILVIAGRITPAFTQNALRRDGIPRQVRSRRWLGALAIGSASALALATLFVPRTPWTGALAALAALAAAGRLAGWQSWHTRHDPLLWSLHAGSIWLVAGLGLVAASDFGAPVPPTAALHALTAGGIGATILAVVTRVSLGHTGRPLVLPAGTAGCYGLVYAAALLRVGAPFLSAELQRGALILSALAWAAAFAWFTLGFASILTRPRIDGGPG